VLPPFKSDPLVRLLVHGAQFARPRPFPRPPVRVQRLDMQRLAAVVAASLAAVGCGGGGEPERWAGPPPERPGGTLDVTGFVAHAAGSDEPWTEAPLLAAAEYLRLDRSTARTTALVATTGPEGTGPTTVTATLDRLLDDSVRAKRYDLVFARDGDGVRLTSARWTQQCWPGRGHQDFTTELCR
jgi:hypothetical protein